MATDPEQLPFRAAVLTVSDAAARGERDDESGRVAALRAAALPAAVVWRGTVADEPALISEAVIEAAAQADLLIISGGTGLAPRDRTPQALAPLLDYEVPGMAEAMRARGLATTPHAMLSRQLAGVRGACLILALPGSPRAVGECLDAVWPALPHALRLLAGRRDPHHPPGV